MLSQLVQASVSGPTETNAIDEVQPAAGGEFSLNLFRNMLSLKPERSSIHASKLRPSFANNSSQVPATSPTRDNQSKVGKVAICDDTSENERSFWFDIRLYFLIESLLMIFDVIQYIDFRSSNLFTSLYDEWILGGSAIFSLSMILVMSIALYLRHKAGHLEDFFNTYFNKNIKNIYAFITFTSFVVQGVLRVETLMQRPQIRLNSLILMVVQYVLVMHRLPPVLAAKTIILLIVFYLQIRLILLEYQQVYSYISCIGVISITCFTPIHTTQEFIRNKKESVRQVRQSSYKAVVAAVAPQIQTNREVNNYFKELYHNIVSMMPQGIVILDESENLVYANKTTKKILECHSKSDIIETLRKITVKDLSQQSLFQESNFFDNGTKSYRTIKSMKSNLNTITRHPNNNNNNTTNNNTNNNNNNTTNLKTHSNFDTESQSSTHYFYSNVGADSLANSLQPQYRQQPQNQIRQIKDKRRMTPKQLPSSMTNAHSMLFEKIDKSPNFNAVSTLHDQNSKMVQIMSKSEGYDLHVQIPSDQQSHSHSSRHSSHMGNSNMPPPESSSRKMRQSKLAKKQRSPFKFISCPSKVNQKTIENMSIMEIVSYLLKECAAARTSSGRRSVKQQPMQQSKEHFNENDIVLMQQDYNNNNNNNHVLSPALSSMNQRKSLEPQLYAAQRNRGESCDLGGFYESQLNGIGIEEVRKHSVKQSKDIKQLSQQQQQQLPHMTQMTGSQKSILKTPERTNSVRVSSVYGLGNQISSVNGSSHKYKASSMARMSFVGTNSVKNQSEIAQNSLQVRIQRQNKMIDITFVQCDVQTPILFRQDDGVDKQQFNNTISHHIGRPKSVSQLVSQVLQTKLKGDEDIEQQQHQQQQQHQKAEGNNKPEQQSRALVLVFIEDVTREVYAQRLEGLNNFKMKMLSSVSHELKTPLNCSMGMLDQVNQYVQSEEFQKLDSNSSKVIQELIAPAQQSNFLLLSMIRDLLDLGSIELGVLKYQFTRFNLKNLLEDRCKLMRMQGQLKKVEIVLQFDSTLLDEIVVSDENRLGSIILNFLSNSLKFTQKGGKIVIKVEPVQTHFRISVEDNGIGIPKKKLGDLFKIFGHTDFQKRQATQGIGIGLQVSYRLAQGLTLEEFAEKPIVVSSEENKSTVFSFILKNQDPFLIMETQKDIDELTDDDDDDDDEDDEEDEDEDIDNDDDDDEEEDDDYEEADSDEMRGFKGIRDNLNGKGTEKVDWWNCENKSIIMRSNSKPNVQASRSICDVNWLVAFSENIPEENEPENDEERKQEVKRRGNQNSHRSSDHFKDRFPNQNQQKQDEYAEENIQAEGSEATDFKYQGSSSRGRKVQNTIGVRVNLCDLQGNGDFEDIEMQKIDKKSMRYKAQQQSQSNIQSIKQLKAAAAAAALVPVSSPSCSLNVTNNEFIFSQGGLEDALLLLKQHETIDCKSPEIEMNSSIILGNHNITTTTENTEIDGEVLIVDDVEFNLLTLSSLLKKYNMKINMAHDGQEALEKVQQKYNLKSQVYKIIFMDIQMPVKDGFEATKDIRKFLQHNNLPAVPIVATSAFGDDSYKEHAKKVGMTDYMEKPLKIVKLDKMFAKYVQKQ